VFSVVRLLFGLRGFEVVTEALELDGAQRGAGLGQHLGLFLTHVMVDCLLELVDEIDEMVLVLGVLDPADQLASFTMFVIGQHFLPRVLWWCDFFPAAFSSKLARPRVAFDVSTIGIPIMRCEGRKPRWAWLFSRVRRVGPARTHNDFQLKAKSTAETTLSAVGTTQLVVRLAADDRGPDEPERRVRRQYRVEQAG
jgi:hypothetical protein